MEIREGHNKFYINDKQGKQPLPVRFTRVVPISFSRLLMWALIVGWVRKVASAAFEKLLYFTAFTNASNCLNSIAAYLDFWTRIRTSSCFFVIFCWSQYSRNKTAYFLDVPSRSL